MELWSGAGTALRARWIRFELRWMRGRKGEEGKGIVQGGGKVDKVKEKKGPVQWYHDNM